MYSLYIHKIKEYSIKNKNNEKSIIIRVNEYKLILVLGCVNYHGALNKLKSQAKYIDELFFGCCCRLLIFPIINFKRIKLLFCWEFITTTTITIVKKCNTQKLMELMAMSLMIFKAKLKQKFFFETIYF